MRRLGLVIAIAACTRPPTTTHVSIAPVATASGEIVRSRHKPRDLAPTERVVVTNAPYGSRALWRAFASGRIEPLAFPWAKLSIIDSLEVSPTGREVAYVEGGSSFGPLVIRALSDGAATVVVPHVPGGENLVVAWSPDSRKLLYATRHAGQLQPSCHWTGCPAPGPSSHFVFDRDSGASTSIDVPHELAAWLPSGDVVVVDDDAALFRVAHGAKRSVAGGARHSQFSLDVANARLLSSGWDDATHRDLVLSLDLRTWQETPIAPPAPYATYLWPSASPSGKRVGWIATAPTYPMLALVVDGKPIVEPTRDLVGFAWIDDATLVAHHENRLDVVNADNGAVKGSQTTDAQDMLP